MHQSSLNYVLPPRHPEGNSTAPSSSSRASSTQPRTSRRRGATALARARDSDVNQNPIPNSPPPNIQEEFQGFHFHSASSVIPDFSLEDEAFAMRRHLQESRGALNIPPVSTFLCVLFVILYLTREKMGISKEQDICVSWKLVIDKRQYWRLFVAQFFHFNRLQILVSCFTLFTVGRYLERKVACVAMVLVVFMMSALSNLIYISINPWFCVTPQSQIVVGFGNVIYSLRVLLAYALEPRNYERDLVFGLYPMVVSASHAPWQPILDLLIFKIVLPEQCITGQLSGITGGFIVTAILLLWPTKGIYIASPPYYWTMMGSNQPPRGSQDEDREHDEDEDSWKIQTYTNSDFWLPSSSRGMALSPTQSNTSINLSAFDSSTTTRRVQLREEEEESNSLKLRSEKLKEALGKFFSHPTDSLITLMENYRYKKEPQHDKRFPRINWRHGERPINLKRQSHRDLVMELIELHRKRERSRSRNRSMSRSRNSINDSDSSSTMTSTPSITFRSLQKTPKQMQLQFAHTQDELEDLTLVEGDGDGQWPRQDLIQ